MHASRVDTYHRGGGKILKVMEGGGLQSWVVVLSMDQVFRAIKYVCAWAIKSDENKHTL